MLLLDEPLGALDARLRKDLQVELKTLQETLGITFVFVTHDQEEALTMSDRVAVMNGGRVEQSGPPQEMYEEPATLFVADFLGVSNLVGAEASGRDGAACALTVGDIPLRASQGDVGATGAVKAMIRPERVRIEPQGTPGENRLPGLVEHLVFLGSFREVRVRLAGRRAGHGDPAPTTAKRRRTSRARPCRSTCPSSRCASCPRRPRRGRGSARGRRARKRPHRLSSARLRTR